ncbi:MULTISPECIES: hypothetical protein [Aeromonas]|uniref:hypothetical protein n=1 Tax=Aeromonas TaxID=642 RepID=UPI002582B812|nr:hypothetical protein [Aeromonas sp.]
MSLEETRSKLLNESKNVGDLLTLIHDLYLQEIHSEEIYLAEALSDLHNSGEIDLLKIVLEVNNTSHESIFFTILSAVEGALPLIDARVEDVVHCLAHLTQQAGRDLAISGIYDAFKRFCSVDDIHRPTDCVMYIMKQSELGSYAPFISCAILAYNVERVVEAIRITKSLIANSNEIIRNQAYYTLGRLNIDEVQVHLIWELIQCSADSEHDNVCRASILRSVLHLGTIFPSYWPYIEELLITFVKKSSPEVLYAISNIVAPQINNFPDSIQRLLVRQLFNVYPEQKGIIDNIDFLLSRLIEKQAFSLAIELLESILDNNVDFKSLDNFSSTLLTKHFEFRNHLITRWFLDGESSLCQNVSILLHDIAGKDIELNADMTLLDNEQKKLFVSRKAVGWLFTRPIAAASLILSISRSASKHTIETLGDILYDPLLLSYPGELKKFFQTCSDNNEQEDICRLLLDKLEAHNLDTLRVSGLKELAAPSKNIELYWKDFEKDMQKSYEEASKNSFFRLIATPKRLLYGNSSIYYIHQMDGQPSRQEMQMHSFSHSAEMPTLNILDPESLDYSLRIFRCERMKNEINS